MYQQQAKSEQETKRNSFARKYETIIYEVYEKK